MIAVRHERTGMTFVGWVQSSDQRLVSDGQLASPTVGSARVDASLTRGTFVTREGGNGLVAEAPITGERWLARPIPSPMEKRAGKISAQLILIHPQRAGLQQALQQLLIHIDNDVAQRKVRWSVDVDPIDTY